MYHQKCFDGTHIKEISMWFCETGFQVVLYKIESFLTIAHTLEYNQSLRGDAFKSKDLTILLY